MAEQLEIIIGANVDDAKAGVNSLSKTLDDFAKQGQLSIGVLEQTLSNLKAQIKLTTNPEDAKKLASAFDEVNKRLQQLKSQGGLEARLGGISRSARLAHSDIDQIARDLQLFASGNERAGDALSNLVFTFERLGGVAGGAKQAFAALGEAFLGPAGIIIGISTAVNFLGPFITELFSSGEEAKRFATTLDNLKKSLDKLKEPINITIATASGSIAGEVTKLRTLVAQATQQQIESGAETVASITRRKNALQELQKLYKDEFQNIKFVADASNSLAIQQAAQAAENAANRKASADAISKEVSDAQSLVNSTQANLDNIIKERNERLKTLGITLQQIDAENKRRRGEKLTPAELALPKIQSTGLFLEADRIVKEFKKQMDELVKVRDDAAKELEKKKTVEADIVVKQVTQGDFKEANKELQKGLDETQRKIIELAKIAEKVFNVPLTLKFDITDQAFEQLRKATDVLSGIKDFTIKARVDIALPEIKELPKEQVEKFFKNVPSALQDAVDKGIIDAQGRELKIDLGPFSKEIQAEIDKFNQAGLTIPVTFDLKDADLLIKLRDAFPIEQIQKNVDELKKSLGTEDTFQGFIRDLIKLGDEGQKAFDATAKAALDAGDSITEALRKAGDAQNQIGGLTKEAGEAALVLQQTLAPAFESLFSAILEGQAPLDAFFKSLIRGIDQLIAKLIAAALEALILSTITGGIGGFGGIFKALLGFAKGGDPAPDKPFIAGEKGWELIVPKTSMHVFTHEQSKSILSSSLKDNESIKEYLIAARVSQQLKEHFSSAFKSIETTVKTISTSHEKLIAYSYKLHESVNSLRETFVSSTDKHVSSAIEKTNNNYESLSASFNKLISERPQATIGTQSSHYEKSFDNIEKFITSTDFAHSFSERLKENNLSLSTAIEKLSSFKEITASIEKISASDRSITIERIINNNFYTSEAKDSFKSMSLTDIQRTFHIPAFAQGGAVFGPTLAILGEGFGVSRSNPEFVGTASQLKGIQGGQFDINVSVDGELSFSMGKLAVALNREVRSQLRTSGKNPF